MSSLKEFCVDWKGAGKLYTNLCELRPRYLNNEMFSFIKNTVVMIETHTHTIAFIVQEGQLF